MKIFLIGDLTVTTTTSKSELFSGWGRTLKEYLKDQTINFVSGELSNLILLESSFDQALSMMDEQDIVLIHFDHQSDIKEYTQAMNQLIVRLKEKKVQVILCTPVRKDGKQELRFGVHNISAACRKIAQTHEIPVYDLNRYSYHLIDQYEISQLENIGADEIAKYVKGRLREYVQQEPLFKKHYYGACMYPEVWSKEIFAHDVRHMASIGMNFARFGEFAWRAIEPKEGEFDLTIFEEALALYQEQNIDVCICIPTPTPPRWLTLKYPDAVIKNIDGITMTHGSRQHACTNNEDYRKYAYRMTRRVAALAKKYENIIAIQLDNEFKCHVDLCYCSSCQKKWHQFLIDEYQTIEHLNQSWGTNIWSEYYDAFNDVVLPTKTPFLHNSSLMNAFRKFTTQSLNEFAHDLCHFIRMETDVPITHNTAFGFNLMNDRLFSDLDVAGFDTYPPADNFPAYTLNLDRWRNVKEKNNEMLLLETCTSHVGHLENYPIPRPSGFITSEMFIGFAANLKTFSYWHYRGHRFGVEQPHSAVVTSWGEPDIGYDDVVTSGKLAQKMQPFLLESTYKKAKIAFMYSDHAKRFYTIDNGGYYDHRTLVTDYYGSLIRAGINLEVIHEESSYDDFDVLIVPYIRWINPTMLAKFNDFVRKGGKLILGPMTGDRTEDLAWPEKNGLDILGSWLGLNKIKQYSVHEIPFQVSGYGFKEQFDRLVTVFNGNHEWQPILKGPQKEVIAAKRKMERGEVIYIGGQPVELRNSLLWQGFIKTEILPYETDRLFISLEEGLVKYRRETAETIQLYITNMTNQQVTYKLNLESTDLLTGSQKIPDYYQLEGYQHLILSFEKNL